VLKMTIVRYRPMSVLSTFDDVLDDLFAMPFGVLNLTPTFDFDGGYRPAIESFIKGNELHVRAEIPGVGPKSVAVSLDDGHFASKAKARF